MISAPPNRRRFSPDPQPNLGCHSAAAQSDTELQAPALWPVGAGIEYAFADNLTAKLATTL